MLLPISTSSCLISLVSADAAGFFPPKIGFRTSNKRRTESRASGDHEKCPWAELCGTAGSGKDLRTWRLQLRPAVDSIKFQIKRDVFRQREKLDCEEEATDQKACWLECSAEGGTVRWPN